MTPLHCAECGAIAHDWFFPCPQTLACFLCALPAYLELLSVLPLRTCTRSWSQGERVGLALGMVVLPVGQMKGPFVEVFPVVYGWAS